jgi:hypothetical protein
VLGSRQQLVSGSASVSDRFQRQQGSNRPLALTSRRLVKNWPAPETARGAIRQRGAAIDSKVLNGNAFLSNGSATSSTRWDFTILCRSCVRQAAWHAAWRDRDAPEPLNIDEKCGGHPTRFRSSDGDPSWIWLDRCALPSLRPHRPRGRAPLSLAELRRRVSAPTREPRIDSGAPGVLSGSAR